MIRCEKYNWVSKILWGDEDGNKARANRSGK